MLAGSDHFTCFGTFNDPALESAYRSHHADADRRLARSSVLIATAGGLVFIASDYWLFGNHTQFFVLLAVRLAVVVLSLLAWRQLGQYLSPADYDSVAFTWGLLVVTQILYITSTRPPTYSGHLVGGRVEVMYRIWVTTTKPHVNATES